MSTETNISIPVPINGNNQNNQGIVYAPYIPVTTVEVVESKDSWVDSYTFKFNYQGNFLKRNDDE